MKELILLCLIFLATTAYAGDRENLVERFRVRIGEPTAATSLVTDSNIALMLNMSQDKVVRLGGFIQKQVDVRYRYDSTSYALPATFKRALGAMTWDGGNSYTVMENPFFRYDTSDYQYFVAWVESDSAELYLRGVSMFDGQLIRLFYLGTATSMDTVGAPCEVADDEEVYVIEEAISYYEQSKQNYAALQLIFEMVRTAFGAPRLTPREAPSGQ